MSQLVVTIITYGQVSRAVFHLLEALGTLGYDYDPYDCN